MKPSDDDAASVASTSTEIGGANGPWENEHRQIRSAIRSTISNFKKQWENYKDADQEDEDLFDRCLNVDALRSSIIERMNKFAIAVRDRYSFNSEPGRAILCKVAAWNNYVSKVLHDYPFLTNVGQEQKEAAEIIKEFDILPSPRGSQIPAITKTSNVERCLNGDSTIVLDDSSDEENLPVIKFFKQEDQNESHNDSVVIVSPVKERDRENIEELIEEPVELNESVCITRHSVIRKCPITQLPFEEPMRNGCGHIYERSAIIELCRLKSSCPCPVSGCDGWVISSLLTTAQ